MEEVIKIITLVASFIGGVGAIIVALKKILQKIMQPVSERIDYLDMRQCKSFLVNFLNDIENGVEKDEVQYKFAHEVYDHYTKDLNGNSYIHDKWERIMK